MPIGQKWVLIVDDEEEDAFVLETTLKTLGKDISVVSVGSAEAALEELARQPFDLVVTDLRMPGMGGLELVRRVRDSYPETGTILITAYGSKEVETEVRHLPHVFYLPKPLPIAEFTRAAERALQLDQGQVASPSLPSGRTEAVQRTLVSLRRGAGARCVLLADGEGEVVAQAGAVEGLPLEAVLPVLAQETAITACLDQQLDGGTKMSLHHYEGRGFQIYAALDTRIPFLVVVLGQPASPRRSGIIWLFLRRTLQELRGLVGAGYLSPPVGATALGSLTPAEARAMGLVAEEAEAGESVDE